MNELITNQIQESDLNTREELWTTLFCWIDFSKSAAKQKVYNKESQLLPLPKTFLDWQKQTTEFLIKKHGEIETLINSFNTYFQTNIYLLLNKPEGDKTLAFRCDRLLKNKILGESSSLFTDLIIWETEYNQVQEFKELLTNLNSNHSFTNQKDQESFTNDCEKLIAGRINYSLAHRFHFKWNNLINKSGLQKEIWNELTDYLKLWEQGKGAESNWKVQLDIFKDKIQEFLTTESSEYFFSFGAIKSQDNQGLILATQNKKGWDLNNPYLMLFWFHQKPTQINPLFYRNYFVNSGQLINTRNLYTELFLSEDWLWRNYLKSLTSWGSLISNNHPVYHQKNL